MYRYQVQQHLIYPSHFLLHESFMSSLAQDPPSLTQIPWVSSVRKRVCTTLWNVNPQLKESEDQLSLEVSVVGMSPLSLMYIIAVLPWNFGNSWIGSEIFQNEYKDTVYLLHLIYNSLVRLLNFGSFRNVFWLN